jgi:hypothetical protein
MSNTFISKLSLQDFIAFLKDASVLGSREVMICMVVKDDCVYIELGAFVSINFHNTPVIYSEKVGHGFGASGEVEADLRQKTSDRMDSIRGMLNNSLLNVSNGRIQWKS